MSVRYRDYIYEAWEGGDRKVYESASLFCFLAVTYAIYISIHLKVIHAGPDQADSLLGPLVKLCMFSALPLAFLAYADEGWSSHDAAPICLAAWITACIGFSFKCKICALGMAVPFFPFILSALLAHGLGALCRFVKGRIA